jgi:DNA topoisomerase IA
VVVLGKKKLFIVEASGKIKKIKSLLNEIMSDDFDVVATNGRLFDLPKDEMGIDVDSMSITKRVPLSDNVISFLRDKIKNSSHVYVMSDNDIEGEVIAKDITSLVGKEIPFSRVFFNALTTESLDAAINKNDSVNESSVSCGLSRRIFDRLVGFSLSSSWKSDSYSDNFPGDVGRVLSPVLSEISSSSYEVAIIQKAIPGKDGGEWQIDISVSNNDLKLGRNTKDLLLTIGDPEIIEVGRAEFDDDTQLWSGTDTLSNICRELNESPSLVMDCLQELYEDGEISYPRSDSNHLSLSSFNELRAVAESFGFSDMNFEKIKKTAGDGFNHKIQGAHEAVIPLTSRVDVNIPPYSLALKDQVLQIITKNAICAGRSNVKKIISYGAIAGSSPEDRAWQAALSRFSPGSVLIRKTHTETRGFKRKNHQNNTFKYGTAASFSMNNSSIRYKELKKEIVVLDIMCKIGIGRPSTMDAHAEKIAKRFLDNNKQLNKWGELSIKRAELLAPGLISRKNYQEIDRILHSTNEDVSIKDRIALALKEGSITISSGGESGEIIPKESSRKPPSSTEPSIF